MLARVYILLCCCCGGGGGFTQLLLISSWLHVRSFIANFVKVASRVVVCHVKLSRVNSRRIKIRVDLRHVNIRVDLRRGDANRCEY
jgi:hypothetical protein